MAKVDVILTHNVVGLGAESDQVKVAAGYARNYLLPQRLAIPLSATNKRRLEALKQRRAEREAHELNSMLELAKSLSKLTLRLVVKTGDEGKMYGSVTAGTLADELKHQFDVLLDKRKIHLEKSIRTLGDFDVELRLHPEVVTTLKVHIESTTPPPAAETPEGKGAAPGAAKEAEGRDAGRYKGPRKSRPSRGESDAKAS